MNNRQVGDWGERIAAAFLAAAGCKILEKNYKVKTGEIDLIVEERKALVFVEVKTRSSTAFGFAAQAVDLRKQRKIYRTAQWYLQATQQEQRPCRFDVIEVYKDGESFRIHRIQDAFRQS